MRNTNIQIDSDSGALSVLFFTPNWRWDSDPLPVDTLLPPVTTPIEWAYMKAVCDDSVNLLDAYAEDLSIYETSIRLVEYKSNIVVVSSAPSILYWRCPPLSLESATIAVSLVQMFMNSIVVLIGPHATHNPSWTREESRADYTFSGSPELLPNLFSKIVSDHLSGKGEIQSELDQITVLAANELPVADFSVFSNFYNYEPHMWDLSERARALIDITGFAALVESSRGCPWTCVYCAKEPVRGHYQRRKTEDVLSELEQLSDLGVEYVYFIDETFNFDSEHNLKIISKLKNLKMKFGFQGRADLLSKETAMIYRDNGCIYVELGIDTLSGEAAKIANRQQSRNKVEQGLKLAKEYILITRFNRLNMDLVDYKNLGLSQGDTWDFPPDPAIPFPGSLLGKVLMRHYGNNQYNWIFAQEYSWWLKLEVAFQREKKKPIEMIEEIKERFLALPYIGKKRVIQSILPISQNQDFRIVNCFIEGVGRGV